MYHYDPNTALEELQEEALLPNPVHIRDMIVRARLAPGPAERAGRTGFAKAAGWEPVPG